MKHLDIKKKKDVHLAELLSMLDDRNYPGKFSEYRK